MFDVTSTLNVQSQSRPVVASYCATFLKPEMLHIYRQISGLRLVRSIVIAQKREHADLFPFEPVDVIGKPATHFLRRFWFRQLLDEPWQISRIELDCDEKKVDVLRTGIPLDEFPFLERSSPESGEWRFVQAGRLIEKKGLPTTLRAFAIFLARYPRSTLTIAGEGPLLEELKDL